MMLLEPTQTKVAMTVLPRGGFWGLNSFPICVPFWGGRVPLNPHSAIVGAVASVASTGTSVGPGGSGGLAASVQAAASSAARSPVDLIWPPCRDGAGGRQQSSGRAVGYERRDVWPNGLSRPDTTCAACATGRVERLQRLSSRRRSLAPPGAGFAIHRPPRSTAAR